ncbi:MAG: tRNA dihydrouridine synthase DusB [Deltaproteobacteria bacterium]|nr:MAG: tRNA dihydrouridine synthase DusB [Deltaproteobacteria bacterium]
MIRFESGMDDLWMAPLRGLTGWVYRSVWAAHFSGIVNSVSPFITTVRARKVKQAFFRDLFPENNENLPVIPQILGNDPGDMAYLVSRLEDLGYDHVNWNLGCPYKMVAKKKRGSGLLPFPDQIDAVLDTLCRHREGRISVKLRLGRETADEIQALIPVLNAHPLSGVILHPRTGVQMYAGRADRDAFGNCLPLFKHPVMYNGDITTAADAAAVKQACPAAAGQMLGRGLLCDPFLPETISGANLSEAVRRNRLKAFHDDLLDRYRIVQSGEKHVLDKMKGLWVYQRFSFADPASAFRQIRKTASLDAYTAAVTTVFDVYPLKS